MKSNFNINYVCEVNYPNTSAYSIHVLKMCDAFSDYCDLKLFVPSSKYSFNKIKKEYKIKNNFTINKIFKTNKKLNFFYKIIYSLRILINQKNYVNKKTFFISRSIIFAIVATLLKKNVILELHHNMSGLTKILYEILKYLGLLDSLKYIFIHKNLNKIFKIKKNNYICLDDAVNLDDFKIKKKEKKYKNTCVYVGSFHKGKGVELIKSISRKTRNIDYHLYGDKNFLNESIKEKNIKIYKYVKYRKIPLILSKYHVALMPYGNFIAGRLKKINLINYISPLKMFDYLASSNIILASDLGVYKHILKHQKNSILIKNSKINLWSIWIQKIFNSINKYSHLKKNAFFTASKFTWANRAEKIINFSIRNFK